MQMQPHNHQQRRQLLIIVLTTCGASIIGGSMGLLLGRQADMLFNVDAGILGVVAGAVIGSLVLPSRTLNPVLRSAAAGFGVLLPVLTLVGSARVAPEVLWSMTAAAIVCSGGINTILRTIQASR